MSKPKCERCGRSFTPKRDDSFCEVCITGMDLMQGARATRCYFDTQLHVTREQRMETFLRMFHPSKTNAQIRSIIEP